MSFISYIIVTYNSNDHFPAIIDNIRKFTPLTHEIIVIDNGSASRNYLQGDHVELLRSNTYFTHAVNVGLQKINEESKYVILVNPDVRIFPQTISIMLSEVERQKADISGALLIRPDLTIQHGGGSEYDDLSDSEVMALTNHKHTYDKESLYDKIQYFPRECRWVTGAFFLITRSALNILGPLDEQYIHYKSDIEYCLRARLHGMKVICSSAICLHFHKRSIKRHPFLGHYWTSLKYSYQWYRCLKRLEHP